MPILYRLDASAAVLARAFAASAGEDPWAGGTIAPGTFAPVITSGREFVAGPRPDGDPPRRLIPRLWGVPPPRSAGDPARGVLTVRNPDSPFWIGNLRNSEFRCLVPASAFMVWGKGVDREGKRNRHWFTRCLPLPECGWIARCPALRC
jgi:putative SOS response-associated peptidase YedK